MKHIYAFEDVITFENLRKDVKEIKAVLDDYQKIMEQHYELKEVPRACIWTTEELATTFFSSVPIPAFTNNDVIYMSPDVASWQELFVKQLDNKDLPDIQRYYEELSIIHIATIAAHELTHHSDLFLDEFDDDYAYSIWFEEGMCEYLPRKHLLSSQAFAKCTEVESKLVSVFQSQYGGRSLNDFGAGSYTESLSSIMFEYWRSFLTVKHLVEVKYNGDVHAAFQAYHTWHRNGKQEPLTAFFDVEDILEGSNL
ncbi:hypothetical protein DX933_12855 [Ornithinibacillus gellani]|uniref:hypothetical protein n=1 Tax=Ornithinibacillus gellani TaxID=2293253 RepID=UPI000F4992AC|nr:hypothetical protein [Ornithinibacillus gellani]TQS74211.1 hypothetical protein DX933_12855 [Ornithinibacillus gellani]